MNKELGKMWKEARVSKFEVLARHLAVPPDETRKTPQSR
jgi:hypothetical protein